MKIKKFITLLLAFVLFCTFFASCGNDDEAVTDTPFYKVTFNTAGGSEINHVIVKSGETVPMPEMPTRDNYLFNGWHNGASSWDFSCDKVKSDITLTAQWIEARSVFDYKPESGNAIITKYKGSLADINIPSVISGLPVIKIDSNVFKNLSSDNVNSITLPSCIVSIGESAFEGCDGIRINVEGKISYIGEKAFMGCNSLSKITFSDNIEQISYEAFLGCSALNSVTLPASVNTICENAFESCSALKTITLPAEIAEISDSAFYKCSALKSVFYYGTQASREHINIAPNNDGNKYLTEAKWYFYSPEQAEDGWYFDSNGNVRCW